MHLSAFDYVFWLLSPCLQVGVVVAMRKRGLTGIFPFFYLYTWVQVLSAPVLLGLMLLSLARCYYFAYWSVAFVCVLIAFALIKELFEAAFRQFAAVGDLGTRIFRWALVVVFFAAIGMGFAGTSAHGSSIQDAILLADRCGRAMLGGLAVLLLLGSGFLHIRTRSVLFGIALGFAMFSLSKAAIETLLLRSVELGHTLSRVNSVAYAGACTVWLAYILLGELPLRDPSSRPRIAPPDIPGSRTRDTVFDALDSLVEESLHGRLKTH